jgi:hypothetical protein
MIAVPRSFGQVSLHVAAPTTTAPIAVFRA